MHHNNIIQQKTHRKVCNNKIYFVIFLLIIKFQLFTKNKINVIIIWKVKNMKKIVTYIVIFISLTAFYVKADSCDGYELRLRDNLQKEEVLKCLTTYKEAKEEMEAYKTDENHVTVIYK